MSADKPLTERLGAIFARMVGMPDLFDNDELLAITQALAAVREARTAAAECELPSNGTIAHTYAKMKACLKELLRLYDWRNELGRIERDFNHDKKQMSRWLNQYGREKKAAWDIARNALAHAPDIDVLMLHERIQREAQARSMASAAAQLSKGEAMKIKLDEKQSKVLAEWISDSDVTLHIGDGYSGRGLYVSVNDYPEEGAEFIAPLPA